MKKRLIIGFLVLISGFSIVFGEQYLYFTGNGTNNNGFQQGCWETLDVNYNIVGYQGDLADKNVSSEVRVVVNTALVDFTGWISYTSSIWNNLNSAQYPKYTNGLLEMGLTNNGKLQSRNGLLLTMKNIRPHYNSQGSYLVNFVFSNPGEGSQGSWIGNGNGFTSSQYTGTITIVQTPCADDKEGPVIDSVNFDQYKNKTGVSRGDLIFDIKDSAGNQSGDTNVPFIWKEVGGQMVWTGNNGSDKNQINNQIGVNTGSVYVTVRGTGSDGIYHKQVSLGTDIEFHNFSVKSWTGNVYRDFSGKVASNKMFPVEFGIEETVTLTITGADRNGKTGKYEIQFNQPSVPQVQLGLTSSERNNFSQSADIKLTVTDEWAGVSGNSIKVVLSGTNEESSGMRLEFTGTKTCLSEGTCEILGSGGGYNVEFNPKALGYILPNYAKFDVLVTACDLKGCAPNHEITDENIGSFTVAPPCWELQCCGDVDVYINDNGSYVASGSIKSGALIVSGGNNPSVEVWESTGTYIFGDFFYTGWVVEINCNVGIPTFTIIKGLPKNSEEGIVNNGEGDDEDGDDENGDDENGSDGGNNDEGNDDQGTDDQGTDSDDVNIIATGVTTTGLYLSGNYETTKAIISGNIITLAHYIDTLDVEFTSPKSNLGDDIFVTNDTSTGVHFEWEYEYGSEKKGGNGSGDRFEIAGFDFKLWLIDSKWGRGDNGGESGDIQSHSLSTFDISGIYSGDLGDLGDPLVERYLPCGGVDPCTGLDLDALPNGLYTYAVVASDLGSNTGGLVSREIIDPETIDINEELSDSGDNVAQGVLVSNGLVPSINMINPKDGSIQIVGEVNFEWTVDKEQYCQGLFGPGISGFQYEIKKGDEVISSGFTTDRNLKLELSEGTYNMSMFIVYNGEFKGSLTGSLMEETFTVTKRSSGGGGGGNRIPRDDCPDGDYSDSYYDGLCEGATHGSAVYQCRIDESRYSDELKLAYLYSYINHVTTMCPIEQANLDGYLYRDHFAKMISAYAIGVLGRTPDTTKPGCDQFDDIADDTVELKNYIKLACQLNLMGMESDGQTVKKSFDPYSILTRAEFGTVFSRLLFGDKYNVKDESSVYQDPGFWYKGHLQALKEYGVMTQIDGTWPAYKEKRGRVMLMLMRADHYGLFEGFSPALNGIDALFAKKWTDNVF